MKNKEQRKFKWGGHTSHHNQIQIDFKKLLTESKCISKKYESFSSKNIGRQIYSKIRTSIFVVYVLSAAVFLLQGSRLCAALTFENVTPTIEDMGP